MKKVSHGTYHIENKETMKIIRNQMCKSFIILFNILKEFQHPILQI